MTNSHLLAALPLLLVLLLLLLHAPSATLADSDWLVDCGVCHCKWNSGKKTADCKETGLQTVPADLSSDIQLLEISNNHIAEFRREEFGEANLQNLHKIVARNSTIQEVNRDAFRGLTILFELDMSNNEIRILRPGTFAGLVKLRTVILNYNRIEKLDDRLFDSLGHLHKVELKHNRLHRIGLKTFLSVPQLQKINLDFNRLTMLKRDTFSALDRLGELSLTENPWNCSCDLRAFRDFVIDRNLYTAPTACETPRELNGKQWPEVASESFACAPQIIDPAPGKYLTAGTENVTLTCRVRGSKMDIRWLFNKRNINPKDSRIKVREFLDVDRRESVEIFTSELHIAGLRSSDKGTYVCRASNPGGLAEADIHFDVSSEVFERGVIGVSGSPNWLIVMALVAIGLLLLMIIVLIVLCCYCRRVKSYSKGPPAVENGGLIAGSKTEKTANADSMIEGGSVIMEMQKSLLTEVNPVEKPPRRADIESSEQGDVEDGSDAKRKLIEETILASHDDETHSIALSDTTPRSRTTFVDDGYGTNLPPDLIAFPRHAAQQPASMQGSLSHLPAYGKSPLASPVYQQAALYASAGFRTLQHPKTGRTIAVAAGRSNSPFTPAPLIYPPSAAGNLPLKQGYVTIPRKPRTPSWAPSANSTTIADLPPTSPASPHSNASSVGSEAAVDPVYDNLGVRTTASGHSSLPRKSSAAKFRDRPLPATPVYEPIREMNGGGGSGGGGGSLGAFDEDTEPLYAKSNGAAPKIVNGDRKVPPRPPPKPKKKPGAVTKSFQDEGEDGTEV